MLLRTIALQVFLFLFVFSLLLYDVHNSYGISPFTWGALFTTVYGYGYMIYYIRWKK